MLVAVEHETEHEYGIFFQSRGDFFWALMVLEGRWQGHHPGPLFAMAWPRLAELLPPVNQQDRRDPRRSRPRIAEERRA